MSAVELCGIGKSFAPQAILRDLNLRIESGQYVVLLGPSGCGKTTTLRLIAGLEHPDQGHVSIAGRDMAGIPPRRRDVAMVFQGDALYPHLSIRESIAYALNGFADADDRVHQSAAMVGIDSLLDRLPSQLSGGELRRASVAKAIARRASVRLLDEPLSAIDTSAAHAIQDDLVRWHETFPGATLHVTHDGNEAMRVADKIAVMHDGHIVQFDSPSVIFDRPGTIDVAAAIGWPPMTFLSARLTDGDLLVPNGQAEVISLPGFKDDTRDVTIGVRPDAWRLRNGPVAADMPEWIVPATLKRIRQIDNRWLALFDSANKELTAMFSSSRDLDVGQIHRLSVSIGDAHLFDTDTGKRIGSMIEAE